MTKYVVLFPECCNVHLVKDVGMIPYYMNKLYGWNASVACYKNEDQYEYLETEVKGLNIEIIPKVFHNSRLDGLCYIARNAKEIDILQIYHIHSTRNYYWIDLYKRLNPKGKVYLKLDTHYGLVNFNPFGNFLMKFIRKRILRKCMLISAEGENTAQGLTDSWDGCRVEYIANGFYFLKQDKVRYEEKANVICTVGRIGTYQKDTKVLLQAYRLFEKKHPDWTLRIVGSIEKEFRKYIDQFLEENKNLKNKIVFTGEIRERDTLYNEYRKAKIFCLTSRWESCGIVLLEAMSAGCYVISSNVYSAYEITDYGRFGHIFSKGDYIGLYKCLLYVCEDESLLKKNCMEAPDFILTNYNYQNIVRKIHDLLMVNGK